VSRTVGRNGGERSYLSIREVLDLIVEEFPDVTISKIRFLESRGLIHPERTPSGYRKFYEPDVERLRWILRQQREHFLPLKVIKGRLEGGLTALPASPSLFDDADQPDEDGDDPPIDDAAGGPRELVASHVGAPAQPALAGENGFGPRHDPTNGLGLHSRRAMVAAAPPETGRDRAPVAAPAQRAVGATEDDPGLSSRGPWGERASLQKAPAATVATPRAEGPRRAASVRAVPAGGARLAEDEPGATAGGGRAGHPSAGPRIARSGARSAAAAAAASTVEAATEVTTAAAPAAPAGTPPAVGSGSADQPTGLASGASLSAEELASAIGEGVELVAELEEFGLIAGREIAGVRCYDEEALIVARIAAGFRRFGIESRHLRTFKHAAEREASLFGQVVTPLLRQRNPAARERAHADLAELAELGSSLQTALLRAELRDLTGG